MNGVAADARPSWRGTAFACALLFAAWALYARLVVRDFSGPLIAAGDANYFEYLGYHLQHHFKFGLPPTIDFQTTDVGYPTGANIVFLSWCVERDLLCALLRSLFGQGPWIQIYCAASPGIAAFGTFFLLRSEVGVRRALWVAFAGAFMAFYAAYKFPIHLNMSVIHWGTLSIVVDYLFAKHIREGRRLTARLLMARVALLPLLLGLDLGYVAGYALSSFTVTIVFCAIWLFLRRNTTPIRSLLPTHIGAEIATHPFVFALWTALLALGVVIYLPTTFVIVHAIRAFPYQGAGGSFWASQARLLIPFFPFLHPDSPSMRSLFGDADGVAEFSTGWALLVLAILGLRDAKRAKNLALFAPLFVTFALCFLFHPQRLPTLHIFPWFAFNRVAGRSTIYFPLFFALMSLGITRATIARPIVRIAIPLLIVVEVCTAYLIVPTYAATPMTPEIATYMRVIHDAPGEAIFDFPFCIAGANGVGTTELCPYYRRLSTSYSYRRFHEKKVLGFYLSRLYPSQIETRIAAGWPSLFSPDDPDPHRANHETRCFDDAQWAIVSQIESTGKFGGIQLYTDFLPPECVDAFHEKFGPAVAHTELPGVGHVEFIRK